MNRSTFFQACLIFWLVVMVAMCALCARCDHRTECKCGWDQTGTLQAMGLVE